MAQPPFELARTRVTLFEALLRARDKKGGKTPILEDHERKVLSYDDIIRAGERPLVPLGELVTLERTAGERNLYRKNLRPVVYVTGDVAGAVASPAYALFAMNREIAKLDGRDFGGKIGISEGAGLRERLRRFQEGVQRFQSSSWRRLCSDHHYFNTVASFEG